VADKEDLELDELSTAPAEDSSDVEGEAAVKQDGDEEQEEGLESTDTSSEIARTAADLEAVFDIPVHVSAVLGKSRMQVSQLLKLGRGAVVELDRKVGEAIDIYVNNRLVARGEVVVVEDRLGVTMTEIIKSDRRQ